MTTMHDLIHCPIRANYILPPVVSYLLRLGPYTLKIYIDIPISMRVKHLGSFILTTPVLPTET